MLDTRYELVFEKINEIKSTEEITGAAGEYFKTVAAFFGEIFNVLEVAEKGQISSRTLDEAKACNDRIFAVLDPDKYDNSFLNYKYSVGELGTEIGQLLGFLFADITGLIPFAFEGRKDVVVMFAELFVMCYVAYLDDEEDEYRAKNIKDNIYWFYHDNFELLGAELIVNGINPKSCYIKNIVMNADLDSDDYLYRYGMHIGENELGIAHHLRGLSQDKIDAMARTFVEGYRKGFETTGRDISIKDTVGVEFPIGFERVIRSAVNQFDELGLMACMKREGGMSIAARGRKRGVYTTSFNKQFEFDHKEDLSLILDKSFADRRLEVIRTTYEQNKELARAYGGPAVTEVFGEKGFEPVSKDENPAFTDKQNEINVYFSSLNGQITNEFIPGDEYSFTIISYPIPAIGEKFTEIFDATVEINNLDYELYQSIQQKIIDVLDEGECVHVTGRGDNHTDIRVKLHHLDNPAAQTNFENCVADVNIPVGEVFTSPVLEGTNGVLHVTQVYLNGMCYRNLELKFKDGMIEEYGCSNFDDPKKGSELVFNNVMFHHKTLPIGEFAIGTNTTAYRMGLDYNISDKLPILIAEKTGPHFAVGDTCYSHAEDVPMMNPDGKECIARDNSVSMLRNTEPSKAYFNCHTDITIPYYELGDIIVECADGRQLPIILDGKFVVPGTEILNSKI